MPKRSLPLVFAAAFALAVAYAALLPAAGYVEAVHAQPCADLDGDGKVTLTDFKIVFTYLGPVSPGHPADLNQDGFVTISQEWIAVLDAIGTVTPCQDTPLGFGGTITPTPVATPVPAEISLNVKSAGAVCDAPPKPAKCTLAPDSTFTLSVSVNQAPPAGYTSIQTHIYYGSLTYKPTGDEWNEVTWQDTYLKTAHRSPHSPTGLEGLVYHTAITGVGGGSRSP